jgi:metal-responsive CopG/Arc/MetJ family transcriptional regulator
MKTTIDIPSSELKAIVKNTGAKSRSEAVLVAVREFNRRRKLASLADRLKGALPNFMTLADLKTMRQDAKWEAAK